MDSWYVVSMPPSRYRGPAKFLVEEPVLGRTLIPSGPALHQCVLLCDQPAMSLRILTSSRAFLPAASRGLYALLRVPSVNHAAACTAPPAPRRSWTQEPLASRHAVRQVRMASSSSEGPITSELISSMRQKIAKALETELVEVQDMQVGVACGTCQWRWCSTLAYSTAGSVVA